MWVVFDSYCAITVEVCHQDRKEETPHLVNSQCSYLCLVYLQSSNDSFGSTTAYICDNIIKSHMAYMVGQQLTTL